MSDGINSAGMHGKSKPVIGIVGGLAYGKSTVAAEFGRCGCAVIDCDKLGHDLLQEDEVRDEILSLWGRIADCNGQINRSSLAEIVFSDDVALTKLNSIMHPRIRQKVEDIIRLGQDDPNVAGIIVDAPALIEAGWEELCSHLVFIDAPESERQQRSRTNRNWTSNNWSRRENAQISIDKKRQMCSIQVCNSASLLDLRKQTRRLFLRIFEQTV